MITINEEGLGTWPYRITSFEPENQLILERYEDYWGGWEGNHFDRVIFRVASENRTRRQMIEQGDVDIFDNLTPEATAALKANPDIVIDHSYSAAGRARPGEIPGGAERDSADHYRR